MTILYKYIKCKIARHCIRDEGENGTLRVTQPTALNDPFECAVNPSYATSDQEEENRRLSKILTALNQDKPITKKRVQHTIEDHGSMYIRQLVTEQLSTRFGIVSFCKAFDHPLMWAHYAENGFGLAIGYDSDKLRELATLEGYFQPVTYTPEPPPIYDQVGFVLDYPESNVPFLLYNKNKDWSYEQEWRLIVELSRTQISAPDDGYGNCVHTLRIPNDAVVRVYHTERTPSKLVRTIRSRLADESNGYSTKRPRKLIMSPRSYRYEEENIENFR